LAIFFLLFFPLIPTIFGDLLSHSEEAGFEEGRLEDDAERKSVACPLGLFQ
jgi:hypothetical protein